VTCEVAICWGKYSSFKIYKLQVQGTSLCTWGVVCRELCSNYQNSLERFKLGKSKGKKGKNYTKVQRFKLWLKPKMDQLIKSNLNLYKLYWDLEIIDCPMKLTKALSQWSEASLIVLTYFHGVSSIKLQN